jgi:hypothetical protein
MKHNAFLSGNAFSLDANVYFVTNLLFHFVATPAHGKGTPGPEKKGARSNQTTRALHQIRLFSELQASLSIYLYLYRCTCMSTKRLSIERRISTGMACLP